MVKTVDVNSDKYQFGFKAGHSTGLCTSVMKNFVDYYTNRVRHVFLYLGDFPKAVGK